MALEGSVGVSAGTFSTCKFCVWIYCVLLSKAGVDFATQRLTDWLLAGPLDVPGGPVRLDALGLVVPEEVPVPREVVLAALLSERCMFVGEAGGGPPLFLGRALGWQCAVVCDVGAPWVGCCNAE